MKQTLMLREKHLKEDRLKEDRPWGRYEVICAEKGAKAKRIEVSPGKRLSLQKHRWRTEKWTVMVGQGVVTVGARQWPISAGSFIEIPCGELHRIQNTGDVPLVFMEVQFGDYLGEDDIIRVEDDFGRE